MNVTIIPSTHSLSNLTDHDNTTGNGSDVMAKANEPEDPEAYLYDLGTRLFVIIDMVLVVLGCLGNILTFCVSMRKRLRSSPVTVFIAALALFDTLVLVLDFMNNWLELQLNIQPLENFEFCVFHRWFFNVVYTTSAWLVAGVAVERLIAVWFPLTAKNWCTVKNSVIAVVSIPIIISVIYLYNFWMWEVVPGEKCEVMARHAPFMNDVSPWLTAVLYSYIPLLIIVTCSVAITIRLASASEQRKAMTNDNSAAKDSRKVTFMVVAICVAFICLTVPLSVWYIWVFATQQFSNQGPRIVFIEIIILIVGLTNHSVNFFIYVLTSERFRSELLSMLCVRRSVSKNGPRSPHDGSSSNFDATKSSRLSSSSSMPSVSSPEDVSSTPAV